MPGKRYTVEQTIAKHPKDAPLSATRGSDLQVSAELCGNYS
jgi:hypothetical protein